MDTFSKLLPLNYERGYYLFLVGSPWHWLFERSVDCYLTIWCFGPIVLTRRTNHAS